MLMKPDIAKHSTNINRLASEGFTTKSLRYEKVKSFIVWLSFYDGQLGGCLIQKGSVDHFGDCLRHKLLHFGAFCIQKKTARFLWFMVPEMNLLMGEQILA